jgi:hypothetical protein
MPRKSTTEPDADVLAVAVGGVLLWKLPLCRLHERKPVAEQRDAREESRE